MSRIGRNVLLILGLFLAVAVAVEGLAGFVRVGIKIARTGSFAEQSSYEYDKDLGWIARAGFKDDNFFGPGRSLHVNQQRFRSKAEISKEVPKGKVRVVCSGDSYTFGYGVSDDATWCSQLEAQEPRIQSVNIGQGGYGIDQSYILAQKVRRQIDENVHLFAFNCYGFNLMRESSIHGYNKPMLGLDGDKLVVLNQPVPKSLPVSQLLPRILVGLRELNTFSLMGTFVKKRSEHHKGFLDYSLVPKIVEAAFQNMETEMKASGGIFVLVRMPIPSDMNADCPFWSKVSEHARNHGWRIIDIPKSGWPATGMDRSLYLHEGDVNFQNGSGHLNEEGNKLVATIVLDALSRMPEFTPLLQGGLETGTGTPEATSPAVSAE